jgi:hypothetical protein
MYQNVDLYAKCCEPVRVDQSLYFNLVRSSKHYQTFAIKKNRGEQQFSSDAKQPRT